MQNDIQYFNLEKYLKNINIESDVLEHLGELQESFDKYLKILMSYGHEQAVTYLTLELFNEMLYSNQIEENKVLPPADFISNDLLATSKYLTNRKICDIQKLLLKDVSMPYPIGEYRNVPVFIKRAGEIIYNAPTVEDLNLFMRDFIKIYNCNNDDLIHNDPFIKSALIHFLFIKIHPFVDGNGRVTRFFISHIASRAGYYISWGSADPDQLLEASIAAIDGDYQALVDLLEEITIQMEED